MRRALLASILLTVVAIPAAATAKPSIPRAGDQLGILGVGPTAEFTADAPFHVSHGWFPHDGVGDDEMHLYDFQLFIDGREVHGAREVTVDRGEWTAVRRILNFRDGLGAGTYVFHGVWTSPYDPPESSVEQIVEVTFTD